MKYKLTLYIICTLFFLMVPEFVCGGMLKTTLKFMKKNTDDAISILKKYSKKIYSKTAKFGDEALELSAKYFDDAVAIGKKCRKNVPNKIDNYIETLKIAKRNYKIDEIAELISKYKKMPNIRRKPKPFITKFFSSIKKHWRAITTCSVLGAAGYFIKTKIYNPIKKEYRYIKNKPVLYISFQLLFYLLFVELLILAWKHSHINTLLNSIYNFIKAKLAAKNKPQKSPSN